MTNEKAWESKVEAILIDGLRSIENADGDPLSTFRKKEPEMPVSEADDKVAEANFILVLIGAF